jgi:outer membrane protein
MKINKYNGFVFALLAGFVLSGQAQTKQWTLQECVRYAMDNNITIKMSELDIENAAIDQRGALGNFLPSVNANGSHSWNIGRNVNPITNVASTETSQFTRIGLNAGVDLYRGLQNQNAYRRAKLSIAISID